MAETCVCLESCTQAENSEGIFGVHGNIDAERKLFEALDEKEAKKEVERGIKMIQFARNGHLTELQAYVQVRRPLFWFTVKIFQVAAESGQLGILQYMVQNGAPISQPPLDEILTDLVEAKKVSYSILRYLVQDCGIPVSKQRRSDWFSPLHIACAHNDFELVQFLVNDLGADVNAVAAHDCMPLHCCCPQNQLLTTFLKKRGARDNWRRQHILSSPTRSPSPERQQQQEKSDDGLRASHDDFLGHYNTFGTDIQV